MNGLKEHKYMDFLTTIGYIVFALCCVIGFFAHLYISINNVSCLCGDNAASGSSKRYKPFGRR